MRRASGGEGAEFTATGGASGAVRVLGPEFPPDLRPPRAPLAPLVLPPAGIIQVDCSGLTNFMKINDWVGLGTQFEKMNKQLDKRRRCGAPRTACPAPT